MQTNRSTKESPDESGGNNKPSRFNCDTSNLQSDIIQNRMNTDKPEYDGMNEHRQRNTEQINTSKQDRHTSRHKREEIINKNRQREIDQKFVNEIPSLQENTPGVYEKSAFSEENEFGGFQRTGKIKALSQGNRTELYNPEKVKEAKSRMTFLPNQIVGERESKNFSNPPTWMTEEQISQVQKNQKASIPADPMTVEIVDI